MLQAAGHMVCEVLLVLSLFCSFVMFYFLLVIYVVYLFDILFRLCNYSFVCPLSCLFALFIFLNLSIKYETTHCFNAFVHFFIHFFCFSHPCSVWEKKWRRLLNSSWFMISIVRSWWVSALNLATSRPSPAFSQCSRSSPMRCWGCWDTAHHRAS